jgi:hypothetical protein
MKQLFVVEVNKSGVEHCFFNAAMLSALIAESRRGGVELILFAERTHREAIIAVLPAAAEVAWEPITVVSGFGRNFLKKFLVEVGVLSGVLRRARRSNASVVLLSMFANALALALFLRPLLRRIDLHMMLHCEVESLIIPEKQAVHREGFWTRMALFHFFKGGWPKLYLLGDGIRKRLLQRFPAIPRLQELRSIEHPYLFGPEPPAPAPHGRKLTVGFVGTGRVVKGINEFFELAETLSHYVDAGKLEFVVIGGLEGGARGADRRWVQVLADRPAGLGVEAFSRAVASLDCAVFLYRQNYSFTASGAVFDVINAGTAILSLQNYYLSDLARLDVEGGMRFYPDVTALAGEIASWIDQGVAPRGFRYPQIREAHSAGVQAAMAKEIFGR